MVEAAVTTTAVTAASIRDGLGPGVLDTGSISTVDILPVSNKGPHVIHSLTFGEVEGGGAGLASEHELAAAVAPGGLDRGLGGAETVRGQTAEQESKLQHPASMTSAFKRSSTPPLDKQKSGTRALT